MNNIEFIHKEDNHFLDYWNSFLDKHPHSIHYHRDFINYLYSYCNIEKDLSFIAKKNDIIIGICFVPIEVINNQKSITLSRGYTPIPLSINIKSEKIIFEYLEQLIKQNNITNVKMFTDSNLEFNINNQYNHLKRYNFLETNSLNLTIDLTLEEEQLWSNLSKSFKSLINKYKKNTTHSLHIMNKDNPQWDIMETFWQLHKSVAQENARDISLFHAQYDLIQKGLATLIYIQNNKEYISFGLFFHYNQYATYASSVSKNIESKPPLSHYILWNAITNFKKSHHKLIQFGQPSCFSKTSGIDDVASDKELYIASFKRNMGAIPSTFYRGIKFYNPQKLKEFLDNYYHRWLKENEE